MKRKNTVGSLLSILSFLGMAFCLIAYFYMQRMLTPAMPELSETVRMLSWMIPPFLLLAGIVHLILLVGALKALTGKEERSWAHSVYLLCIVLSGITLLSDVTLLSDIGKEYLLFNVGQQWLMLYGFTVFHLVVILWGFLFIRSNDLSGRSLLKGMAQGRDAMFVAIHRIGLLCGLLGIAGVFLAMADIIDVAQRFRLQWMVLLSGLSIFPLILLMAYWLLRNRKRPLADWLDEKQMLDTATGALISMAVLMTALILSGVLVMTGFQAFPTLFWLCLLFFLGLTIFCATVVRRNPSAD